MTSASVVAVCDLRRYTSVICLCLWLCLWLTIKKIRRFNRGWIPLIPLWAVAAEAVCDWGRQTANQRSGDRSRPEAESFSKNMCKFGQIWRRFCKNLAVV